METTQQLKPSVAKPWLQFFSKEAIASKPPKDTIYNVIKAANKDHLDNKALNYFGKRITYKQLFERIEVVAAAFEKLGVKKGDTVVCCTVTIPEMVYTLYALNKIGATLFTVDPRMPASFVKETVEASNAKVLMYIDLYHETFKPIFSEINVEKIITISASTSLPRFIKTLMNLKMPAPKIEYTDHLVDWKTFYNYGKGGTSSNAKYGDNEIAAITLTGGTTGMPKGVMLTNDGFNAVMHSFVHCGLHYKRYQRFLNIIPAFSSYGIVASLHMPLGLGLETVVIPKFNPDKVGYYVKKYRPAHTLLVPSHYEKLMNSKEMRNGFDLSFFETAGSGGDTMNEGLETKLNNFLKERGAKFPLSQGYGMSEVSSAASCCCNGNFRSQSVGYPLLNTVISIFEPGTSNELGFDEVGEICISGPSIMAGYFNNPEETEKVMKTHPDGTVWIHSGDLGRMDKDGFVYIKGRIKRMITLFNGHKVFPTQVENVIGQNEDVQSCAVVGVKDRTHAQGEKPLAVVQVREGSDENHVRDELNSSFMKDLDFSSRPFDIEFVGEMPHTGMEKIDYNKLAEDYEQLTDGNE